MKKIGFYLFNRDIINVDFRFPLDGNPGVGGSEYLIVLTAWQLSVRDNGLDVKNESAFWKVKLSKKIADNNITVST